MKVFIAGATGALGSRLVPLLVGAGARCDRHDPYPEKKGLLRDLGARPVVADALDPDAVAGAVAAAEPEVIVHQLTALSGSLDIRRFERTFALTNRLRTEGTDNLLAAGRAVGASRFVAQSFAGWPSARTGGPVTSEDDPLDTDPPDQVRTTLEPSSIWSRPWRRRLDRGDRASLRRLLRSRHVARDHPEGEQVTAVRGRKFPLVGGGHGVWSLIHIDDAAAATAVAVERGRAGLYNIVDDEPAEVREWLPVLADALGAQAAAARCPGGWPGSSPARRRR